MRLNVLRGLKQTPALGPNATYSSAEAYILESNSISKQTSSRLKTRYVWAGSLFALLIAIVGVVLLIFSIAFINFPGPSVIYNHFPAVFMSACLIFECLQVLLLSRQKVPATSRFRRIFRWIYWTVLVLTTFISGIGWAVAAKRDAAAVQFLAFLVGIIGCALLVLMKPANFTQAIVSPSKWYFKTARAFNRFFKVIHAVFSILFAAGAITLALQFRFENPGKIYNIPIEDGRTIGLNVYCTSPPSATAAPTLWFESTQAHGITDFLGVQTYLLQDHGRPSCSYDHVSFGWSATAPKDFTNSSMHWSNMLKVLGRQDEPYVGIGWGGGGEDILSHAIESPSTTKGAVFLDVSPDGIEWMDAARNHSWDETQLLQFRQQDLTGRVSLTQIILALGIPWGLMPIFVHDDSESYFDQSLYPRHHAQGIKDDLWSFQYYALREMRAQSNVSTYLTDTVLPTEIPVYSIITNNSNTASDVFQLGIKVDLVEHIARGKDKVKKSEWCTDSDCGLAFPVNKARWTAEALISLGI